MDMENFYKWDKEFSKQNLYEFNHSENGLLWLKVRAVCRTKQLQEFLEDNGLTLVSTKIADKNIELFEKLESMPDAMQRLDAYLNERNHEWYEMMNVDEEKLKEDLYRVKHYEWGGDQNNSLDRYLVGRYVKLISRYDELLARQNKIAENAWNYVQASWYNNWTSYLIESLFKRHRKVVSAVGEIKSVDFFLDGFPIDLKVTFFPNQFMAERLKAKLGNDELVWLRRESKKVGVITDKQQSKAQQMYVLSEKLKEKGEVGILNELNAMRKEVLLDAQKNPMELAKWLYMNQGEMRFGAENRLFLVLVDMADVSQSWKMKRAFSLIAPKVKSYLDSFNEDFLKEIDFEFKGKSYKSLADVMFVVKN